MRILVVEDEPRLLGSLAKALREEGYAVDTAGAGDDGLFKASTYEYDAIVLDVMLPRLDGWAVLEQLRQKKQTPVLMLTARDATPDRVRGLDTGADDYLVKPFDLGELLARLRALIRRSVGRASSLLEIRDVVIDTRARSVTRAGAPVSLTAREYAILEYLMWHRGEVVTRTALYEHLFDETDTNSFYFVIWSRDGTELKRSTNAPASVPPPDRYNAGTRIHDRMNYPHREAFQLTEFGDCVLAGRQITTDLQALRQFAGWLILAGIAVLGLGLGGGWTLANRALAPVHAICSAASRISDGNLAQRINIEDTDNELGHLATVLNSTFARLESAFAQQRQFTADASHELRTPLTVMISEAQTTLARERSAVEYRESLSACLDTAQSMRKLAQSLLELARLDAGQERLDCSSFDLADCGRACVDWIAPMAASRQLHIVHDLQEVKVFGDPDRLSQVVVNLLTNAVHYNHDGGRIRISTHAEPDAAILTVANTGPGIAAADLPHIFERFYRADKSRTGADGHSGLGLAICKAVIDAHNGSITAASNPNDETTFTVRLPSASDENVQTPAPITTSQPEVPRNR